jgi:type IV secretion system protein VirB1
MDLLSLAFLCGPMVDPAVTLRIISVESGGDPYVIHDDSAGMVYRSPDLLGAAAIARSLLQIRHRIDIGLMQINYEVWLKPTRFALARALEPCTNIRLGTIILSANYAHALSHSRGSQDALNRALSTYNSGSDFASLGYAERVLAGRVPKRFAARLAP